MSKLLKNSQKTLNLPARYDPLCPQCPAEGPASRFAVEERFRGFRLGVGFSRHDVDEATVWDIRQEEWENAMIDAQWD